MEEHLRYIQKDNQEMYNYDIVTENGVTRLVFPIAKGYDTSKIKVELTENGGSICIGEEGYAPFLCGKLPREIEKTEMEVKDGKCSIQLKTKEQVEENWNLAIVAPHEESKLIDPMSAFVLFNALVETAQNQKSEELFNAGVTFLQISAAQGFIPASLQLAQLLSQGNNKEAAEKILKDSFERYGNPQVALRIGHMFFNDTENGERVKEAEKYFKFAYENDDSIYHAKSLHGLILSPHSNVVFDKKDAVKAKQLFEEALSAEGKDIVALTGLSILLYYGADGVEKNQGFALELNEKAREISPVVPSLPVPEPEPKPVQTPIKAIIGCAAGITTVAVIGFFIYRKMSKK